MAQTVRKMVIAEATETKTLRRFVVEVNEVDEKSGDLVQQHARTPFEFASSVPDDEIREAIRVELAPYLRPARRPARSIAGDPVQSLEGTEL